MGRQKLRLSAVRTSAADRFINKPRETPVPSGRAPRGEGACARGPSFWSEIMWSTRLPTQCKLAPCPAAFHNQPMLHLRFVLCFQLFVARCGSLCSRCVDWLLQLACRFLFVHSSPATGTPPRDLLPIPHHPVSEVWEPVIFHKEGTHLRKVPASSELNDWLLLVVTVLNCGERFGARDQQVGFSMDPAKRKRWLRVYWQENTLNEIQGVKLGSERHHGRIAETFHKWAMVMFVFREGRNSRLVGGGSQMLFLCVRDPKAMAQGDRLRSRQCRPNLLLFQGCAQRAGSQPQESFDTYTAVF